MSDPVIPGSLGGVLRDLALRLRRLERRSASVATTAYLGEIRDFARSTVPDRWLECDGSAISRTTYADLFAILGTTWGAGDGSTTFNIPDFQGEFLIGRGASDAFATSGGSRNAVSVSHTHTATTANDTHLHSVDPPATNTNNDTHNHSYYAAGTNKFVGNAIQTDAASVRSYTSTTNDTHNHSVNIAAFNSANDTHNHTVTVSTDGVSATDANLPPFSAVVRGIYAGI